MPSLCQYSIMLLSLKFPRLFSPFLFSPSTRSVRSSRFFALPNDLPFPRSPRALPGRKKKFSPPSRPPHISPTFFFLSPPPPPPPTLFPQDPYFTYFSKKETFLLHLVHSSFVKFFPYNIPLLDHAGSSTLPVTPPAFRTHPHPLISYERGLPTPLLVGIKWFALFLLTDSSPRPSRTSQAP